jgi:NADH-quinone oxidoreductase subunit H
MITSSALIVTLFLGGWQFPYLETFGLPAFWTSILQILTFVLKVGAMLFFYMWVRWTIPRFRYDQLMDLGWKVMLPMALLNIAVTGLWILLFR